ncbi:amino acid ABC transporter permease [Nordella sp. HKS 07]|uniref:amino acid ABC transporter permease n=1 Tax=Nordella sp. HKS 07 TaxID=2712222 RepID=UPI001FEE83F7|nr:amino acid ABC transporter permease [Nordella sp. HKS 07]
MTAITFFDTYAPLLLSGLWATLRICFLATVLALPLGLGVALLLRSRYRPLKALGRLYVEVMRGTPILVVLFLLYYGGPSIGLVLEAEPVGIIGLGLYGAGYFAEIFRAGLQSIAQGQREAARMLGIPNWRILTRIELPQMRRLVTPPVINQVIVLIKESAALSIITVPELTKIGAQIANETFAVIEPYLAVALLYWLLIELFAIAGHWLERKAAHG